MAQPSNERTLIPCLIPQGILHTNGTFSLAHEQTKFIAKLVGVASSLTSDFIIRLTGRTNILFDTLSILPFPSKFEEQVIIRTLASELS
jgi:hypothetical protein